MSETAAQNTSIRAALPSRELRVVNWPLRDVPLEALAAVIVCAVVGGVSGYLSSSWSMGVLAAVVLALAVWKLWFPIVCDLGPAGITLSVAGGQRHVAWRQIDQVRVWRRGVLLVGRGPDPGLCGLYLPWTRHPGLVQEFFEQYGPNMREPRLASVDVAAGTGRR
jgi:hypothetical protein